MNLYNFLQTVLKEYRDGTTQDINTSLIAMRKSLSLRDNQDPTIGQYLVNKTSNTFHVIAVFDCRGVFAAVDAFGKMNAQPQVKEISRGDKEAAETVCHDLVNKVFKEGFKGKEILKMGGMVSEENPEQQKSHFTPGEKRPLHHDMLRGALSSFLGPIGGLVQKATGMK